MKSHTQKYSILLATLFASVFLGYLYYAICTQKEDNTFLWILVAPLSAAMGTLYIPLIWKNKERKSSLKLLYSLAVLLVPLLGFPLY
ncbi:hypothetical protein QWY31_00460 [Cytophagales bacterium LB-30]|uniref:Uncharacterized protein n=1 Tax=Shiella aurantiaca TaxID=3058365 RepID=A0ABT8F0H8_9BACT|nr:hypothetical protein [Shiella aurantiaca]MDN4163947.1 hypothetical protein [Shiella aurantiaca]